MKLRSSILLRLPLLLAFAVSPLLAEDAPAPGQGAAGLPAEDGIGAFLGEPRFEAMPLFESERFPNVVVTTRGTVLATFGHPHVRARRSTDGGATWGPEIPIGTGIHGGGTTVNERNGEILVFLEDEHPPAPLTMFVSTDDGLSWAARETRIAADANGRVPSLHMNEHGISLRHGPRAGRLLVPSRSYGAGNGREFWDEHYANAIFSDDDGATWTPSAPFPARGTGEAAIVELADGCLHYNSRRHRSTDGLDPQWRHLAWSDDGGATWDGLRVSDELPDGNRDSSYGLMGGLVRLPVAGEDFLLFSNIDSERGRRGGTVWLSRDGGRSWPLKRRVDEGSFAYSSMDAGRPGTASEGWIYLHYESGGGSRIARFNLAWLEEAAAGP